MYYHTRKVRKSYRKIPKLSVCAFCDPHHQVKRIVLETTHAFVIENMVHYSQWEMRKVMDHLMVIPKKHVTHLQQLSKDEQSDIIDLIASYESKGYDIFARSPDSQSRSVPHQHTHLIKTDRKIGRALLFLRKPHILWRLP